MINSYPNYAGFWLISWLFSAPSSSPSTSAKNAWPQFLHSSPSITSTGMSSPQSGHSPFSYESLIEFFMRIFSKYNPSDLDDRYDGSTYLALQSATFLQPGNRSDPGRSCWHCARPNHHRAIRHRNQQIGQFHAAVVSVVPIGISRMGSPGTVA